MKKIIIKTLKLKEMLNNVKNAVSKDERRPAFGGILLEATGKNLTMTACDGYKLFTSSCELLEGSNFSIISPVFNIFGDLKENTIIEIDNEEEFITFDFGNVKISYKIIKDDFIEWRKLLERKDEFSIRFNPKYLKQALSNTNGTVEMFFVGDKEAVIIKEVENENNQKYILPIAKRPN